MRAGGWAESRPPRASLTWLKCICSAPHLWLCRQAELVICRSNATAACNRLLHQSLMLVICLPTCTERNACTGLHCMKPDHPARSLLMCCATPIVRWSKCGTHRLCVSHVRLKRGSAPCQCKHELANHGVLSRAVRGVGLQPHPAGAGGASAATNAPVHGVCHAAWRA